MRHRRRGLVVDPDHTGEATSFWGGSWCFKVAGISWVERSAASGSPPEASFEEALGFAERSYELRASKKAALLAQCYDKLNQRAEKKEWS